MAEYYFDSIVCYATVHISDIISGSYTVWQRFSLKRISRLKRLCTSSGWHSPVFPLWTVLVYAITNNGKMSWVQWCQNCFQNRLYSTAISYNITRSVLLEMHILVVLKKVVFILYLKVLTTVKVTCVAKWAEGIILRGILAYSGCKLCLTLPSISVRLQKNNCLVCCCTVLFRAFMKIWFF